MAKKDLYQHGKLVPEIFTEIKNILAEQDIDLSAIKITTKPITLVFVNSWRDEETGYSFNDEDGKANFDKIKSIFIDRLKYRKCSQEAISKVLDALEVIKSEVFKVSEAGKSNNANTTQVEEIRKILLEKQRGRTYKPPEERAR